MKNYKNPLLCLTLLAGISFLSSCNNNSVSLETISSSSEESITSSSFVSEESSSSEESSLSSSTEKPLSTFVFSDYPGVAKITDIDKYFNDTLGDRQPLADDNGIIVSPYHTLIVNTTSVPVYSTRVGCGIHSFAYILVNEDYVNLNIQISTFKSFTKTVVLPISSGVTAKTFGNIIQSKLNDFGNFSFAFEDTYEWGLTIMVAHNEPFSLKDGYKLVEYEPGDYSGGVDINGNHTDKEKGSFKCSEANTAYYFKKGRYLIHDIKVASNVDIYFEPGTYLEDYCYYESNGETNDGSPFLSGSYCSNFKIYGNALCDFASHVGSGPTNRGKSAFGFATVQDSQFTGLIGVDNSNWTLCFTDSTNIEISWVMLMSYKECSDGIMLSDCQDSYVHHNFCRVGDDAIEAKSTGAQGSKNLLYEYNTVWADKCRCYGCIYESNHDMENIIFRHNSVGFSLPNWTDLGCLVVAMGNNNQATWHDIHFEDTEIYYAKTQILSMYAEGDYRLRQGGRIKNIYFKDITCYGPFFDHEELVYIRIAEESHMGKCYIDNFKYKNAAGEMVNYTKDDVSNTALTYVNVSHTYSLKNIVVS